MSSCCTRSRERWNRPTGADTRKPHGAGKRTMMLLADNCGGGWHYLSACCNGFLNSVGPAAYTLSVLIIFKTSGHVESASVLEEQPKFVDSPPGTSTFMEVTTVLGLTTRAMVLGLKGHSFTWDPSEQPGPG